MMSILKAEFLKIFTVRSTYILTILAVLLTTLFALYFEGYRGNTGSPAALLQPEALDTIITSAVGLGVVFVGIISILFMAHEYRYNTIMYTLTASASRLKVLFGKIAAIAVFSVGFVALISIVAVAGYYSGVALRGASVPAQDFNFWSAMWPMVYYGVANGLVGLLFAVLFRSIVAAIAMFFIIPGTIEALLGIVMKENVKYLPFMTLEQVAASNFVPIQNALSQVQAAGLFAVYLTAGFVVAAILFVRRDAN